MLWDMLWCAWVLKSLKCIWDKGIVGMDFLSEADSHIDIVKKEVSING